MPNFDTNNAQFDMAARFVHQTARHLFLTGKAGTGKTTFLRYIRSNCPKKLAVLAPTGVAAINAGGNTIHSFFQLPLGSFLPINDSLPEGNDGLFFNQEMLLRHIRYSKNKRSLLQELELLIIDEVSMVRADLLDAVDVVLRYVRKRHRFPFGGVQMLFIGDLSQLPPVVRDQQWKYLSRFYQSAFFFNARVLQQNPPLYLELKKIYRQQDHEFIQILNQVRNQEINERQLSILNKKYQPDFKPEKEGEYIILTTHNARAEQINRSELKKLKGKDHFFQAEVIGDFHENAYPAEFQLGLKKGAQVMFIRNDQREAKRFYNGKLATIKNIKNGKITVTFPGEDESMEVERETWKRIRYRLNPEKDEIEEEELGSFTQYPLRLAWAITIHKSQGLTFDKAIIDAGESFAPGQVYVALSRLTSLEGLVLYSKIPANVISTDAAARQFSATEPSNEELAIELKKGRDAYMHEVLIKAYRWDKLLQVSHDFREGLENRRIPFQDQAIGLADEWVDKVKLQRDIAEKFVRQLDSLMQQADQQGYSHVKERIEAANQYFIKDIQTNIFEPFNDHYQKVKIKPRVKKYLKELDLLRSFFEQKKKHLTQADMIVAGLVSGTNIDQIYQRAQNTEQMEKNKEPQSTRKKSKGETKRFSLELFQQGKSIEEIAGLRELTSNTILGHLASFLESGEVRIEEIVAKEKISIIEGVIYSMAEVKGLGQIKAKVPKHVTYGEIKAVLSYVDVQSDK